VTALPRCSDVDLLCDGERVIDLDAKISDRALHLGVPEEQLNRPKIAGTPIYQRRLGAPSAVLGPRDFAPFLRLASARLWLTETAARGAAPRAGNW
jgi:hypothetical protein